MVVLANPADTSSHKHCPVQVSWDLHSTANSRQSKASNKESRTTLLCGWSSDSCKTQISFYNLQIPPQGSLQPQDTFSITCTIVWSTNPPSSLPMQFQSRGKRKSSFTAFPATLPCFFYQYHFISDIYSSIE